MGKIIGTGFYVPERIVKNSQISDHPEWIETILGIKERRDSDYQSSADMGYRAAIRAILKSKMSRNDIDVLIVATATPEKIAPSTACIIARMLDINCMAFDINAVCSGFLYALTIADTMDGNVLIVGVDTFSNITDYEHRDCVFFGDGAGAVVMAKGDNILGSFVSCDNSDQGFTCNHGDTFEMNGKLVYQTALRLIPEAINEALLYSGINIEDIDYIVPHQPSKKILLDIAEKIGFTKDRVLMNMDKYANTSAATIPILLAENWHKFRKGDKILMCAIGSGWTYGAIIYEI